MTYRYKTNGVCSSSIEFEVEDQIIKDVKFLGGCNGNLKAIGTLVRGLTVSQVIEKLDGLTCGFKTTSCPDQLVRALKEIH